MKKLYQSAGKCYDCIVTKIWEMLRLHCPKNQGSAIYHCIVQKIRNAMTALSQKLGKHFDYIVPKIREVP